MYLACLTETFCGERTHTATLTKAPELYKYPETPRAHPMVTIDDPDFSVGSACIYEFKFPRTAALGDTLHVRVDDTTHLDIHYA